MKGTIAALDKTRPITAAMDSGWGGGFSNVIEQEYAVGAGQVEPEIRHLCG